MTTESAVAEKLAEIISVMQHLSADETTRFDLTKSVAEQVDMDSLRTFELVMVIHEAMEAALPEDVDLEQMETVEAMADYIIGHYSAPSIQSLIALDRQKIEELVNVRVDEEL